MLESSFLIKEYKISFINLSRFTIGRRIEDLSNNIEETLKEKTANFQWFFWQWTKAQM
jgi:hypothetical protein